ESRTLRKSFVPVNGPQPERDPNPVSHIQTAATHDKPHYKSGDSSVSRGKSPIQMPFTKWLEAHGEFPVCPSGCEGCSGEDSGWLPAPRGRLSPTVSSRALAELAGVVFLRVNHCLSSQRSIPGPCPCPIPRPARDPLRV